MIIHYDCSVVLDEFRIAGNPKQVGHRRTVCRSTGDRRHMPAGRLSDKVSSELGFFANSLRRNRAFLLQDTGIVEESLR